MIFTPHDPGPARPPAPPKVPAVRVGAHPLDVGLCRRHQHFAEGCETCDDVLARRIANRTAATRRAIERDLMAAPGR